MMHYIDTYSKYALAVAIIVIIILISTRPRPAIPSDEYKLRAAQLEQEKKDLLVKRDSILASLKASQDEIAALTKKDSALQVSYVRNKELITKMHIDYEKKRDNIDRYSSDDIKRRFAELTER